MGIRNLILVLLLFACLSPLLAKENPAANNSWAAYGNYYEHSFTYLHNIPIDKRRIGFLFQRPDLRNYYNYNSIYNFNLYVDVPVSRKFNLEVRLPFSQLEYSKTIGSYISKNSTTGYGNLSFLLQLKPDALASNITHFAFGVTMPVFTADFFTFNFRDYIPANNFSVFGYYQYVENLERNYLIAFEIGPRIWIPTSEASDPDAQVFLDYGASTGIYFDNFFFNAELIGVINLSAANDYELLQRNNLLSVGLEYRMSSFNFGINYGYILKSAINKYAKGIFSAKMEIII